MGSMRHPLPILVLIALIGAAGAAGAEAEPVDLGAPTDELPATYAPVPDMPPAALAPLDIPAMLAVLEAEPDESNEAQPTPANASQPENETQPAEPEPTQPAEPEPATPASNEPAAPSENKTQPIPLNLGLLESVENTVPNETPAAPPVPDVTPPELPEALPADPTADAPPIDDGSSTPAQPSSSAPTPVAAPAAPLATALVASVAGAAGIQGGALLLRPLLDLLRRVLFLPLYARLAKDQLLDHETRQRIMQHLEHEPGACIADIHTAIGVSAGCVRHHLRALESNRIVSSLTHGRRRCYFLARTPPAERRAAATLASAAARRVYQIIERQPGISQQELAAALAVSPTSIVFHARRLEENGVVRSARLGRQVAYWPSVSTAVCA